jgi:hypothetical protein
MMAEWLRQPPKEDGIYLIAAHNSGGPRVAFVQNNKVNVPSIGGGWRKRHKNMVRGWWWLSEPVSCPPLPKVQWDAPIDGSVAE